MQYPQVNCAVYPEVPTIAGMVDQVSLTPRQLLLMDVRDKLCGRNAAELARRIGKDATYVNRLFYPKEKAGHKGIGLEIMEACSREFFLPRGYWDRDPSTGEAALEDWEVARSLALRQLRNAAAHGDDPLARKRFERALAMRDPGSLRRRAVWGTAAEPHTPGLFDLREQEVLGQPEPIKRKFYYSGMELPDPGVEYTPNAVREFYAPGYPELARCVVEGPVTEDGVGVYSFRRLTGTKGAKGGMQPILSWEHEDDLPPGDFVMVPRLDVHLSAGNGAGSTQVEIQFNEAQPQAFRADWIRQQHLKPKKLAAMTAHGDSMEHTIYDGDSLLIDTSQTEVADGRVYALWYEGGERVKRLFRLPGGGLRIKSDNSSYGAIELGPEYLGHVRVIGRVVHRSGRGGL